MIRELALTEFKLKYQGSVLGYVWSIVKPLLMFAVLYVVFTHVLRIGSNVPHYAQQLLLGIVLWTFFTDSTMIAISSIVDRGDLLRKVYFPRIVIPVSTSISALITLVLNFVVVLVFIVAGGVPLRPSGLALVPLLIEFYILALGSSLLLAALYVRFRDFKHIWEVLIQALFYATPIIYPLSILPAGLATLFAFSPIAQIIEDARWALISPAALTSGQVLHWPLMLVPYLLPIVVFAIGYRYFESAAASFAEEI
ncbi:MAG: ABC transporter permease [Acidimicrobiaceae bacterium]|nr:ABC transporter permease [Acidimicrobiaceae bacterium]